MDVGLCGLPLTALLEQSRSNKTTALLLHYYCYLLFLLQGSLRSRGSVFILYSNAVVVAGHQRPIPTSTSPPPLRLIIISSSGLALQRLRLHAANALQPRGALPRLS